MLDLSKPLQTRQGLLVRILCTDAKGVYPIVGLVSYDRNNCEKPLQWTKEGYFNTSGPSANDLINIPQRLQKTIWITFFKASESISLHHKEPEYGERVDVLKTVKVEIDEEL